MRRGTIELTSKEISLLTNTIASVSVSPFLKERLAEQQKASSTTSSTLFLNEEDVEAILDSIDPSELSIINKLQEFLQRIRR